MRLIGQRAKRTRSPKRSPPSAIAIGVRRDASSKATLVAEPVRLRSARLALARRPGGDDLRDLVTPERLVEDLDFVDQAIKVNAFGSADRSGALASGMRA